MLACLCSLAFAVFARLFMTCEALAYCLFVCLLVCLLGFAFISDLCSAVLLRATCWTEVQPITTTITMPKTMPNYNGYLINYNDDSNNKHDNDNANKNN